MQVDCEDISRHSTRFRGVVFFCFRGEERRKPEENDEAAIIHNVHLALPASSGKAFWESERLS